MMMKELRKNHDIWVQALFGSLWFLGFGSGSCTFCLLLDSGSIWFLAKPGFCFCWILPSSGSFPSLNKLTNAETKITARTKSISYF